MTGLSCYHDNVIMLSWQGYHIIMTGLSRYMTMLSWEGYHVIMTMLSWQGCHVIMTEFSCYHDRVIMLSRQGYHVIMTMLSCFHDKKVFLLLAMIEEIREIWKGLRTTVYYTETTRIITRGFLTLILPHYTSYFCYLAATVSIFFSLWKTSLTAFSKRYACTVAPKSQPAEKTRNYIQYIIQPQSGTPFFLFFLYTTIKTQSSPSIIPLIIAPGWWCTVKKEFWFV
jgi:hypothetical protein